jgi:acetyl-CoA carboxylase biotin carboxyl carrier protein
VTQSQIDQLRQLSQWLAGTDITLLELSGPDRVVRLRVDPAWQALQRARAAAPPPPTAPASPAALPATTIVRAGSVGVLLHAHPLRAEPLVNVGEKVAAGQTLALLKIGLVLLAVPAPRAGTLLRLLAADGSAVGFGTPLIELA